MTNKPDLSGLKSQSALFVGLNPKCRLLANEGTIRSSKTITAIEIFIQRVDKSKEINHLIACKDSDAINTNILESNGLGLLKRYPNMCKLKKDKIGSYYVSFTDTKHRKKKIMLCGYDKEPSWKKVLGGTIGCIFVDEVNIASKTFIDECFSRQASATNPLTLWTLNGDNPNHWIYQEYINYCKPLMASCVPQSILNDMDAVENKKGYYYFHWNFRDNPVMTPEKIENIENIYPVNSYYYSIKIKGERGTAENSIFSQYIKDSEVFGKEYDTQRIIMYHVGLDIGNNDAKRGTIMTLVGIERGYTDVHIIESYQAKSTEVNSLVDELVIKLNEWYDDRTKQSKIKGVWMDSYGAIQLMLETLRKGLRKENNPTRVDECLKFGDEEGRKARLELVMMLINQHRIHFYDKSKETLNSLKKLVYNEKDALPLDTNQLEMDYYDSMCYALTPVIRELTRLMKGAY